MAKRKAISKKLRFDVFKRDSFTCQYCGKSAPEIVLEVDHINPVSKGGKNNILNLITSCFDCNRGKRDGKLDENTTLSKEIAQLAELQEKKNQIDMMIEWRKGLTSIKNKEIDLLRNHWKDLTGSPFNKVGEKEIKPLIKKYGVIKIIEAMDIAYEKYSYFKNDIITDESWEFAFYKIKGILYMKSLPVEARTRYFKILNLRDKIKSQFNYFNKYDLLNLTNSLKKSKCDIDKLITETSDYTSRDEYIEHVKESVENAR